jgi:hypothetical protein
MSSEQDRRRHAEFLAVGFLTTTELEAGIVKATFTSHNRLKAACEAALDAQQLRTRKILLQIGAEVNMTRPDRPEHTLPEEETAERLLKAALAAIPKETRNDTA